MRRGAGARARRIWATLEALEALLEQSDTRDSALGVCEEADAAWLDLPSGPPVGRRQSKAKG